MKVICIRKGKAKGLTDNKTYEVIKHQPDGYLIKNDLNIIQNYKINRFKQVI